MDKVYCKKCKWLSKVQPNSIYFQYDYECKHSKNMVLIRGGEWYEEQTKTVPENSPMKLNEKNDCEWYYVKNITDNQGDRNGRSNGII